MTPAILFARGTRTRAEINLSRVCQRVGSYPVAEKPKGRSGSNKFCLAVLVRRAQFEDQPGCPREQVVGEVRSECRHACATKSFQAFLPFPLPSEQVQEFLSRQT